MAVPEIEVLDADITTLALDAITNAANTRLAHGALERVVFCVRGPEARASFERALRKARQRGELG